MTLLRARKPSPARETGSVDSITARLDRELAVGPWDHPWDLRPGLTAPVLDPGARQADWTVDEMLEEAIRNAFAAAEAAPEALVLGCGEGRLGHRLLEWGASRVLGVDCREPQLRRAALLRDLFALSPSRLELREAAEPGELDPRALGGFDVAVVELAGHAERAAALVAVAARCTRRLCAIVGQAGRPGGIAASAGEAGFGSVEPADLPLEAEARYVLGRRFVLLARPGAAR